VTVALDTTGATTVETVTSRDGTIIGVSRTGQGPALVLVDGALCYRASGPSGPLATALANTFTVYTYDRRGRGNSTNTLPYAVDREVEDLAAVLALVGEPTFVYGVSSGAALALEGARQGLPISRLALYEAPFITDDSRAPLTDEYVAELHRLVAADRRADAVRHFMRKGIGLPAFFVAAMRVLPAWSKLVGIAHTLEYDTALTAPYQRGTALPADHWSSVTAPTWVGVGTKSPQWMRNAMRAFADALPNATHAVLDRQTHMVKPAVLAPALTTFFSNERKADRCAS
jgi:pimeloyl-ACP methyl ester carboxylesterase